MALIIKCVACGYRDPQLEQDINKALLLYNGSIKKLEQLSSAESTIAIWKSEVETLRLELIFFKQESSRLKDILKMSEKDIKERIDKKVLSIKRREQKEAEKWKIRFGKLQMKILEGSGK